MSTNCGSDLHSAGGGGGGRVLYPLDTLPTQIPPPHRWDLVPGILYPRGQTDACENVTFPLRLVIICQAKQSTAKEKKKKES